MDLWPHLSYLDFRLVFGLLRQCISMCSSVCPGTKEVPASASRVLINIKGMGHKTPRLQSDSWVAGERYIPESALFPIGATALDLCGSSISNQQSF